MSAGDFWLVSGAYFLIVTLTVVCIHSILQHRRTGYLPRPIRFLIAVPYVLIFGTPPQLHPEGRSARVRGWKAIKYAWRVTA